MPSPRSAFDKQSRHLELHCVGNQRLGSDDDGDDDKNSEGAVANSGAAVTLQGQTSAASLVGRGNDGAPSNEPTPFPSPVTAT
mmetsp:Transcript_51279/g.101578  ORF Transcript_51279/g.101578 Transcript_51279/m.101578 type:complete len:83 (-) Transcript_51279:273-521(-)